MVTELNPYVTDKIDFFKSVRSYSQAKEWANKKNYAHAATYEDSIREDFEFYYDSLKKKEIDQDIFFYYCYYCCSVLKNFHEYYDQEDEANEFLNFGIGIKERWVRETKDSLNNDSFWESLKKKISSALVDLIKMPTKKSTMEKAIGIGNVHRIYWYFCRTTITKMLLLAHDLHWLDQIGNLLDKNIDVNNIISFLEKPNATLRVFSVGFFTARFILNAAMFAKHVCDRKDEESFERTQRAWKEFMKRHPVMLNDAVWGTINLITNYNATFHIPDPTANWLVAGFLFFDLAMFLYRRHLEENKYLLKRERLNSELEYYTTAGNLAQIEITCRQIALLDNKWEAKNQTFLFNASAALLLAAGFSASLILTPAGAALACYMICTFAVAMYLSDSAFEKYRLSGFLLAEAQKSDKKDKDITTELKNYHNARDEFIATLTKNAVMPTLFIVTYAVCWQAALVLTAAYIGYQLYTAPPKHTAGKKEERPQVEQADNRADLDNDNYLTTQPGMNL